MSSVVSTSVARADPSDSMGSSPRVTKHCLAGASPEQDQVRLSVVSTGTATVSTCSHNPAQRFTPCMAGG